MHFLFLSRSHGLGGSLSCPVGLGHIYAMILFYTLSSSLFISRAVDTCSESAGTAAEPGSSALTSSLTQFIDRLIRRSAEAFS